MLFTTAINTSNTIRTQTGATERVANLAVWILIRVIMRLLYSIQLKKPVRYEKRYYSDLRSKAYMSQINLQHGTTTNSGEQED